MIPGGLRQSVKPLVSRPSTRFAVTLAYLSSLSPRLSPEQAGENATLHTMGTCKRRPLCLSPPPLHCVLVSGSTSVKHRKL